MTWKGFAYNSPVPFISFALTMISRAISLNATTNNLFKIKLSKSTM